MIFIGFERHLLTKQSGALTGQDIFTLFTNIDNRWQKTMEIIILEATEAVHA